jgi:hypothetical protein
MEQGWGHRVRGTRRVWRVAGLLTAALALAACNPDNQGVSAQQPRGATVAFDSLDGLPPAQFQRLVKNLNDEAQSRRLAVISREQPSAYRVRGYLAATAGKHQTTVSWVWDVFDQDEHRTLRISGEETAKVRHKDVWAAADDAMLQRIAQSSMDQLAVFLTSPAVAPGTAPQAEPQIALIGESDSSPEAAGIFRIFRPQADPISTASAEPVGEEATDPVPLPRRRPAALVSSRETLTLAASRR